MEFSILNLLTVLLVAWLAGQASSRIGYPAVLGELIAGIVLGPPLLGWLSAGEALGVLAEVGILLMMLYIGMEIDPNELRRASKGGLLAALGGFITPFVLCYGIVVWAGGSAMTAIFVGVAAGVTSLATKSRILLDLKLLDTRIAHVMMAGALIADTLSLVIFAAVMGVVEVGEVDVANTAIIFFQALGFFAVSFLFGTTVLPRLGRFVTQLGRTATFTFVLLVAFSFAEIAELVGMHGILGTFIAGLLLREKVFGRSLSKELMDTVRHASIGFLAPVFFVTAGFAVTLDVVFTSPGLLFGVIAAAMIGKVIGTMVFYLPTGYGWREGVAIGASMNGRGAVEIIIAQIGLAMGIISQEIFSILVFMAIATTATVPFFLKWSTDWLKRRGELVRSNDDRTGTLILGAGATARRLGSILAESQPVRLVDQNAENCLFAESEGLPAFRGNILDEEILSTAGAAEVKHVIAMTRNAEVNALASQLARNTFLVPEVHVLDSTGKWGHRALLDHVKASTVFGGPVTLGDWDFRVDHGGVEQFSIPAAPGLSAEDNFRKLQRGQQALPLAVRRKSVYMPFHSGLRLQKGDWLVVLQLAQPTLLGRDRFDWLVEKCPVIDVDRPVSVDELFDLSARLLAPKLEMEVEELATLFHDREASSSTVVLPGLAIPHVSVSGTRTFEMIIFRSRHGIQFPHQDLPVRAAFVIASTTDERTFHLRSLSAIAQIIQQGDFETDWLSAPDVDALRNLLLNAKRRRLPVESKPSEPPGSPERVASTDTP